MDDGATTATLIPVREAAALANVSTAHLYRLIDRGAIRAVRVSDNERGPLRVDREAFLAWLYAEPEEERCH